jgi:hypothetical protein
MIAIRPVSCEILWSILGYPTRPFRSVDGSGVPAPRWFPSGETFQDRGRIGTVHAEERDMGDNSNDPGCNGACRRAQENLATDAYPP